MQDKCREMLPVKNPRGPDCGCVERGGWWWVGQGGYSDLTGGWVLGQGGGLKNKVVNQ